MYAIPYENFVDHDPIPVERAPITGGWVVFIGVWLFMCAVGIGVAVFLKQVILGAIIMGVPTAIGVFASPTFALCCISMVLPMSGSVNFQGVLSADRVVGGMAALGVLAHCKLSGHNISLRGSPLLPMFLLAGWAALSALWSPQLLLAFVSSLTILQLCIWSLAVWNGLAYRGNVTWPLRCYVIAMFVVVMRLYLTGGLSRMARAVGVASRLTLGGTNDADVNPNDFAEFLLGGFFFAVYLMIRDPSKTFRAFAAVCVFVFPVMALLTGARSCLFGLAAALIVTGFTLHNFLHSRGALIGVIVAGLMFAVGANYVFSSKYAKTEAVTRLLDAKRRGKSVENRMYIMRDGLKSIAKRPILGTGYRNFTHANKDAKWTIHNDIMLLTAELGLPGFILIMLFFWKLAEGFMKTRSPAEKWLLRSVLIFFLVTGQAHSCFANKAFWFFPVCAAALCHRMRMAEETRTQMQMYQSGFPMPVPQQPLHFRTPSYA